MQSKLEGWMLCRTTRASHPLVMTLKRPEKTRHVKLRPTNTGCLRPKSSDMQSCALKVPRVNAFSAHAHPDVKRRTARSCSEDRSRNMRMREARIHWAERLDRKCIEGRVGGRGLMGELVASGQHESILLIQSVKHACCAWEHYDWWRRIRNEIRINSGSENRIQRVEERLRGVFFI